MNIFVLDRDPFLAARAHCDKHVGKMLLESVQLLSNAQRLYSGRAPYAATHTRHPCSLWAGESSANYAWLWMLANELSTEFLKRYDSFHSAAIWLDCLRTPPASMPMRGLTPHAQAMPREMRNADAVVAYRTYYIHSKASIAKWMRGTPPPEWWQPGVTYETR